MAPMKRILTRKWFWVLVTTAGPSLWQVLTATPADEAAAQAESAQQLKAAMAICERLDPKHCGG